jgi:hypothetical protein
MTSRIRRASIAAGLLAACMIPPLPAQQAAGDFPSAELRAASKSLDAAVHAWLAGGSAARRDGYAYAMDVAPLMLYAARTRDEALYRKLLPTAQGLVVSGGDASTNGYVLWRKRAGQEPEVTGATEALWMARALWAGASAFGREQDRALATQILTGYARHAQESGGAWRVRRYFSFGSHSFADLSLVSNYDGDFLAETEGKVESAAWSGFGRRTYAMLEQGVSPAGLAYPVIQPADPAVYRGLKVNAYAPNGALVLEDACAGAEGALRGRPELARSLLKFTEHYERRDDTGRLYAYYRSSDGKPIGKRPLSSVGYACLVRVAAALNDRPRLLDYDMVLRGDMRVIAQQPGDTPLMVAGPLLLAAQAAGALGAPVPAQAIQATQATQVINGR